MTSRELAEKVGCSAAWIFYLKRKFADRCPDNFNDVDGWKEVLAYSRTQARVKNSRGVVQAPDANVQHLQQLELSDIARLTKARANKVETEHEILSIELAATRRQIIRQEEVTALFAKLATIVRGRLAKMRSDLPSALLGLDAPAIDKVLGEKMDEALAVLDIPEDFFDPRSLV